MNHRWRVWLVFLVLWLLYQAAEGVGDRVLHSSALQAALMLSCVVVAWPLSRWLGYRGYRAYALNAGHGACRWLGGGLLLAMLAKFAALSFGLRVGVYAVDTTAASVSWGLLLAALPMLLLSTFVPSVAEDILTRGFWYRGAGIRWSGGVVFVLASSTIYVLNHVYRLGNGPQEWLLLSCFGLAYATALWRSGSLWAAVGLHWGWNLGNGLAAALMPATARDAPAAAGLSITAHLLMLMVILALPKTRPDSPVVHERQ